MTKKDCMYVYTYDDFLELAYGDLPENVVVLPIHVCQWDDHRWRLETLGPEVFVAVCEKCGKRTTSPAVLLKLLDDFSYEGGRRS